MNALRALSICSALALMAACGSTTGAGAQGPAGDAGPTGATGPAGPAGATGATGATGTAGPQGLPGAQGPVGQTGLQGPAGAAGAVGATGAQGSAGVAGATGAAGSSVSETPVAVGDPNCPAGGVKYVLGGNANSAVYVCSGENGDAGPQGPQGADGLPGATGAQGNTGPTGAQGSQGNTGAIGPTGATGAQGNTGSIGPTGAPGAQGNTGAIGPTGATGAQGNSGAQGISGAQGVTGAQGATGTTGSTGTPGAAGSTGATGATGATGTFSGQAILNQTALQASADFNIDGNGYIGSALGVGTTSPKQVIDTANGRIRTNGIQYQATTGNYGKITVSHGQSELVVVPWTLADVTANPGMHFDWAATGPRLGDTSGCAGGANPSYLVDNSADTGYPGQYSMTFTTCAPGYCITGTWEGWEMRLFNAAGTVVAGPSHSVVHFMIANENGVWHVEHMSGLVGTTAFECH